MDVDFDVKETGQTRTIAGHNTQEVVMTVTMREKGKTLEESGGMVMTSNSWLAPAIPAMKELAEFEMRYWKAIAPEAAGMSAEQMAAVMVMYPMLKQAMERLKAEGIEAGGHAARHDTVFEAVKSKEAAQRRAAEQRRRTRRHARAPDGEARRQASRARCSPSTTRCSKSDAERRRPEELEHPRRLQGEEVAQVRRQEDREGRALVLFAVDEDAAAALLHDAVDRRQPEAGALALRPWS